MKNGKKTKKEKKRNGRDGDDNNKYNNNNIIINNNNVDNFVEGNEEGDAGGLKPLNVLLSTGKLRRPKARAVSPTKKSSSSSSKKKEEGDERKEKKKEKKRKKMKRAVRAFDESEGKKKKKKKKVKKALLTRKEEEEEEEGLAKKYDLTEWKNEIAKHWKQFKTTMISEGGGRDRGDGQQSRNDAGTISNSDTMGRNFRNSNNNTETMMSPTCEKKLLLQVPLWAQKAALVQSAVTKAFKSETTTRVAAEDTTTIRTFDDERVPDEGIFGVSVLSPPPPPPSLFEQALRANRATQARTKEMLENIDALIERDAFKIEEIKELWQTQQRELEEENEKELKFDDSSLGIGGNRTVAFSRRIIRTPSRRNDDCDDELETIGNNVGKIRRGKMGRPLSRKISTAGTTTTTTTTTSNNNNDNNNNNNKHSPSSYFELVGIKLGDHNDDDINDDDLPLQYPKTLPLYSNSNNSNFVNKPNNNTAFARNIARKHPMYFNDASHHCFKPWSKKDDLALIEGVRLFLFEKRRLRKQVDLEELAGEKKIPLEDILTDDSKGWQSVWENCSRRSSSSSSSSKTTTTTKITDTDDGRNKTMTATSIEDWAAVRKLCSLKNSTTPITPFGSANNKEKEEDNSLMLSRTLDDLRLRWMHALDPRIASSLSSSSNVTPWTEEEDVLLVSLVEKQEEKKEKEKEKNLEEEERKWFRAANSLNAQMKTCSRSETKIVAREWGDDGDDDDGDKRFLRSPFQCLHRYQSKLNKNIIRYNWTKEDDCALQTFVQECGPGRWSECAKFLPECGHTATQCKNRFMKLTQNLRPDYFKKGKWTKEEDEELRAIVLGERKGEEDGEREEGEEGEKEEEEEKKKKKKKKKKFVEIIPWHLVAKKMSTNRMDKQCREHWTNVLQPSLLNGEIGSATKKKFTPEEDAMLLVLHTNFIDKKEFKWSDFESTGIFPGRSGKQCLQRVTVLLKKRKEVEIRERLEREILENKNDDSLQRHILTLHQKKRKRTSK